MSTVYINGHWLPADQATTPLLDRGLLFGDGIYELIPVFNDQPFLMQSHIARLFRSASAIGLSLPFERQAVVELIDTLLKKNPDVSGTYHIYMQITRGSASVRNHAYEAGLTPTVFMWCSSMPHPADQPKSISTIVQPDIRWDRCDIKSISLLPNTMAAQAGHEKGCGEVIMHRQDWITECSRSNVFVVTGERLYTPPADNRILNGTTRMFLIERAQDLGFTVVTEPLHTSFLQHADEAWATSSTRFISPISHINGEALNNRHGADQTVADRLLEDFSTHHTDSAWVNEYDQRISTVYEDDHDQHSA